MHPRTPFSGQHAPWGREQNFTLANCRPAMRNGAGSGTIPSLPTDHASVPDGEVLWFITSGSVGTACPLGSLPEEQRWQNRHRLKSLKKPRTTSKAGSSARERKYYVPTNAPLPEPPDTDFASSSQQSPLKFPPKTSPRLTLPIRPTMAPAVARPRCVADRADGSLSSLLCKDFDNQARDQPPLPNGDFFLAESKQRQKSSLPWIQRWQSPGEFGISLKGSTVLTACLYPPGNARNGSTSATRTPSSAFL